MTPRLMIVFCLLVAALTAAACGGASRGSASIQSPFLIVNESLPNGTEFVSYHATIETEGGLGGPFIWRIMGGYLPSGLKLVPGTPSATIEGVPLAQGVYNFTIEAFDSELNAARKQVTIIIGLLTASQLAIKTLGLPAATLGQPYNVHVVAAGGSGSGYQWSLVSGSLPTGLNHNPTGMPHCEITGMAFVGGVYNFTLRVQDSGGMTATRDLSIAAYPAGSIVTFAGGAPAGYAGDNGPSAGAGLYAPSGVASDSQGNIFIADFNNNRIRRVDALTGIITTYAGSGASGTGGDGGQALLAPLLSPHSVALDAQDNLYIGTALNVRRVDASTGVISTVAGTITPGFSGDGGPAAQAQLNQPHGIALDAAGNLYIADSLNHRVRRVDAASGNIETVAGTGAGGGTGGSGDGGPALLAELDEPHYVAVDSQGNLYIAEWGASGNIRRVDAATGDIETVAYLTQAEGMAIGPNDQLYAVDSADHNAYRVDIVTHAAYTVAGNTQPGFSGDGGYGAGALLNNPTSLCFDPAGNLYITDTGNHRVRKVMTP